MNSGAQISENEQSEIKGTLKSFFTEYHLYGLLKMCCAEKQKGHSAFEIFKYLLCLAKMDDAKDSADEKEVAEEMTLFDFPDRDERTVGYSVVIPTQNPGSVLEKHVR